MKNFVFWTFTVVSVAILANCEKQHQIPSSQYSVSDEYLGVCFIERSPLVSAIIHTQLPDPSTVSSEEYLAAVREISDRSGEKLFNTLRTKISGFSEDEINKFHAYCERPEDASEDVFFQLERIVLKSFTE